MASITCEGEASRQLDTIVSQEWRILLVIFVVLFLNDPEVETHGRRLKPLCADIAAYQKKQYGFAIRNTIPYPIATSIYLLCYRTDLSPLPISMHLIDGSFPSVRTYLFVRLSHMLVNLHLWFLPSGTLITMLLLAAGAPIRTIAHLFWHSFFYSQDDYTAFCQIVLLCSTAGTILLCFDAVRKDRLNAFEFIVLMLLSTCSMLFLISAYDLIAMYLSIELQSLCFYVIAAYNRNSEFATEAGLKYLILGAFASGILLFGCSMIYGSTGGTQFDLLAEMLTGDAMASFGALRSGGIWMGILCLSVGFLFKITAVPFHMWAPDLYEGSPTLVSAFVSIAPKISLFSNLLNTLHRLDGTILQQIFFICSIASMILGALAAMAQTKVKRLLAYSSVGHVGYLCTGYACGTIVGMQSLLIGLFIYVLMTIDAFAIVLALRPACTPTRVKYLADMGAFSGTNPMLAMLFSITIFSYAGIPPLAGFCSKFYLLFAAWGCGLQVLAFLGVFTSVIGCWAAGRCCCCCSRYLRRVESVHPRSIPQLIVGSSVEQRILAVQLCSRLHAMVIGIGSSGKQAPLTPSPCATTFICWLK